MTDAHNEKQPAEAKGGGASRPKAARGETVRSTRRADEVVRDIRRQMVALSGESLDPRTREQAIDQHYRQLLQVTRQVARAEVGQAEQKLSEFSARVRAREAEVSSQRERLEAAGHQLRAQESRLRQELSALETDAERTRRRASKLAARFRSERKALRQRVAAIRTFERELERRAQRARDEIVTQRETLQRQQEELEARSGRLVVSEQNLDARWRELEDRQSQEAAEQARHRVETESLTTEQQKLVEDRRGLQAVSNHLQEERTALAERRRDLDRREKQLRDRQKQQTHEAEEVEQQRQQFREQREELTERLRRLELREDHLDGRLSAVEAEKTRLVELEAELKQQQASLEEARQQAEEAEREAQRYHREALALHAEMEARDQESRQAALELEVEREEFAQRKSALATETATLDEEREAKEAELARVRASLDEQQQTLDRVEQSAVVGPSRWGLRSVLLSLAVGVAAAGAWMLTHPSVYESRVELSVERAGSPAGENAAAMGPMLREHCRGLLSADVLSGGEGAGELRPAWSIIVAENRARAAVNPANETIFLSVRDADRELAGRLATRVAAAYAERINAAEPAAPLPAAYQELARWRDEQDVRLVESRREADVARRSRENLGDPGQRAEVVAEADRIAASLQEVSRVLGERRAVLAVLLDAEVSAGYVDPVALRDAIATDPVHTEDIVEYRAAAEGYRRALSEAMIVMVGPNETVAAALANYTLLIGEQLDLEPPPEVALVLEECAAGMSHGKVQVAAFDPSWRRGAEGLRSLAFEEDVLDASVREMVARHREIEKLATEYVAELDEVLKTNGKRIERLQRELAGDTRAAVIAAALRSGHAELRAAMAGLHEVVAGVQLETSVELDAHDRQLRRLQMRLDQRRDWLKSGLQLEADQAAHDRHAERIETARGEVMNAEQDRERTLTQLGDALRAVRELDDAAFRSRALEQDIARYAGDVTRLESRVAELDQLLEDARRPEARIGQLIVGPVRTEIANNDRHKQAGIAGGAGFAATWLVCVGMVLRRPRRSGS